MFKLVKLYSSLPSHKLLKANFSSAFTPATNSAASASTIKPRVAVPFDYAPPPPMSPFSHLPKMHIRFNPNNIMLVVCQPEDRIVTSFSPGRLGYTGPRKLTDRAVTDMLRQLEAKLKELDMMTVRVEIEGFNMMRNAFFHNLRKTKIVVKEIMDTTPIPFNGAKPRNERRL